jgi:predicted esterase
MRSHRAQPLLRLASDPYATTPPREWSVKSHRVPRIARKVVVVCLSLALLLVVGLAFAAETGAREARGRGHAHAHVTNAGARTTMDEAIRTKYPTRPLALPAGDATILAFPPAWASSDPARARGARSLTVVYLHGIHGLPQNGCPWLASGASELGWLVCPAANTQLANGTFSWGGTVAAQRDVVARAERAAQDSGADPDAANVLVGFSQGAYVALDLVHARLGRVRGLVLIGAAVAPSRAMLEAGGVSRIVLAAGDLDGASAPMKRAAARLVREGMDARFVSLGAIGHSYETTEKEALRDAIVWSGTSPSSS